MKLRPIGWCGFPVAPGLDPAVQTECRDKPEVTKRLIDGRDFAILVAV